MIDMSKLQPWDVNVGNTGGPTAPVDGSNDPYSMDWTKNLPAFYAKNWGGKQGSEQAWYRTPEWAGGVVWNPYWGWQSGSDIKGKYGQGQLSAEDFYGMGLTRNPGEDWQQYYEQLTGMTPEAGKAKQNANYGGTTGTAGGEAMPNTQDWSSLFSSYFPEYGQTQGYTYPDEMNWATDVLGEYAYTGRPTSWSPWYQQAKKGVETDVMDAIKQAAEKAGLGGTRWSTPMGRTAQDISSRAYQDLGTQFMGLETGALENAANRGLTAAQTLPGVAQLRQQMPMDYASNLMGMGQGMNQSYNNMLSPLQQEWMRTQPEYSPWNQYGGGLLGATMGGPQQYGQSGLSQGLGAGVDIASILAMLKFAGLLSSVEYKRDIEGIDEIDESNIYEAIKNTPLFQYRYKFEDESSPKHFGLILEESPGMVGLFNKMVGLYEYIGALHATVKTLIRKVEEMENA